MRQAYGAEVATNEALDSRMREEVANSTDSGADETCCETTAMRVEASEKVAVEAVEDEVTSTCEASVTDAEVVGAELGSVLRAGNL